MICGRKCDRVCTQVLVPILSWLFWKDAGAAVLLPVDARDYPPGCGVEGVSELSVENVRGNTTITRVSSDEVKAGYSATVYADSEEAAEEYAKSIMVRLQKNGEALEVAADLPVSSSASPRGIQVDYTIRLQQGRPPAPPLLCGRHHQSIETRRPFAAQEASEQALDESRCPRHSCGHRLPA